MRTKEKIQFIKRLSFLIKANIPIETSLATLSAQASTKSNQKSIETILNRVKSGEQLSSAMISGDKSFSGPVWSIIRVGEESGTLPESLIQLVIILERGIATKSKIIQALLYPAVILCGTLLLTSFLILYIFPKITPVFVSLKVQLPIATRILMSFSFFLRTNFIWILIFGVAIAAGTFFLLKFSHRVRLACSKVLMKIPFVGSFIQSYILARISMLLGILLASHMKVNEAIELVSKSIQYPVYRHFLVSAIQDVSHGKEFSELCSKNLHLFPPLFTNMIAIGEMSGNFSEVLKDLASIYESELETRAKTFTQMMEPALMIFISLVVGFVAISIITPLYSITSNLRH